MDCHMSRLSIRTSDISEAATALAHARLANARLLPAGFERHPATEDFRHQCSLADLANLWLHGIGHERQPSRHAAITRALELSRGFERNGDLPQGTASFSGLLGNYLDVGIGIGWTKIRHTWRDISRVGSVPDFKRTNRASVSEIPLTKMAPLAAIPYTGRSDLTETQTAWPYAGLASISREALVADQHGALEAAGIAAGVAASATVNSALYALLISNSGVGPTLNQDSVALFHTTHGNYLAAGSGGAPSVSTLSAARKAMRRQTDPGTSRRLNIRPAILLVPPSLESEARVLAAADAIPGADSNLQVVVEAYLEDATNGTTAWYLIGSPAEHDTLEVAFLDGVDRPFVETRADFERDGVATKIRVDFGVAALDYRGMYRNAGA